MSFVDIAIIASALATIILAGCAVIGLCAWKEQHKRKIDSELATRLLVSIRKYYNAMGDFIDQPIRLIDALNPPTLSEDESDNEAKQKKFQARVDIQTERYDKVVSARREFYADILISDVLWGQKVLLILGEMKKIEEDARIRALNELIIEKPNANSSEKEGASQILETIEENKVLFEEFDKLVEDANNYLKPKIKLERTKINKPTNTKEGTK